MGNIIFMGNNILKWENVGSYNLPICNNAHIGILYGKLLNNKSSLNTNWYLNLKNKIL